MSAIEHVLWIVLIPIGTVAGLFKIGEHPWEVVMAVGSMYFGAILFSLGRAFWGAATGIHSHGYGFASRGRTDGGSGTYIGYGDTSGGNTSDCGTGGGDCG